MECESRRPKGGNRGSLILTVGEAAGQQGGEPLAPISHRAYVAPFGREVSRYPENCCPWNYRMKATSDPVSSRPNARQILPVSLNREFLTVVISTVALIVLCRLFAPSSIAYGTLAGSLPFAAILVIVGLGQMLVVQQGGFDLSVAGGVSLAVVISTHVPAGDSANLPICRPARLVLRPGRGDRERGVGRLRAAKRDCGHDRHERANLRWSVRCLRRHSENDHRSAGGHRRRRSVGRRELRIFRHRDPARRRRFS